MLFTFNYAVVFFFFKQKTAYEMRISDWSSDVCSSDLRPPAPPATRPPPSASTGISRPASVHRDSRSRRRANPGAPNPPRRGRPAPAPPQARSPLDRPGDRVERRREPTGRLDVVVGLARQEAARSEEHTSELQSLMRISYAVFCL